MQDLNDLFFFVQVVEHGGFAAAGRALRLPKSRLSRRIALLEERLGVRLLQRTTRKLALTELGGHYLQRCRAMLDEAQAAEALIREHSPEPRGNVRVSCPIALAQTLMAQILPGFLARHPRVNVHCLVTNRAVDLYEEGVDVAIRVRAKPEDSAYLVMRSFGMSMTVLLASPDYLARRGAPETPAALAAHDSLSLSARDNRPAWLLQHTDGRECRIELTPRLVADDMQLLKAAALAGQGITLLPVYWAREELRDGRLQRVLPEWRTPLGNMHCVYPSRAGMSSAVRAFIDTLAVEMPRAASEAGIACPRDLADGGHGLAD